MNKIQSKLKIWIPIACLLFVTTFAFNAMAHEEECPNLNSGCEKKGDDGACVIVGGEYCCLGDSSGTACGLPTPV